MFIEALIEPWHLVRSTWEDHAKFIFKEQCSTYRVLQEATFANDERTRATDTIVVEVQKKSAWDCGRRALRIFQQADSMPDDGEGGGGSNNNNPASKESVVELISRKAFINCLTAINPNLSVREVLLGFVFFDLVVNHRFQSLLSFLFFLFLFRLRICLKKR
jgi:hypothetical protein